jgi:RHS repeat-associated protein
MQANTDFIKGLHLIGKQENEENRRTAYQYDSYYRLRRVDYDCAYSSSDPTCANNRNNVFKCNTAESGCEDFQLDGVHNIRSSYENQTNFAWTVDGFNRLTQKSWNNNTTTYSYDSSNNMTGEDLDGYQNADIVYTYDKLNRLASVTNSDYLVEYSYDPFNRRTEKTVYYADGNDTFERTHKYAYNDWDIISEEIKTVRTSDTPDTVTGWQLRRYVDQGTDNHIIMDTVSCSDDGNGNCSPNEPTLQRIWFHKDERGNIIAISDGNGTIYERYRYRVYGEHEVLNADFTPKSTAAVSPFLWGGSLYEPETNLYWMRNRYYHIDMHRFINQDPIGIWGDANNLGNGFAYVAGMVIEASDPTGLDVEVIYWLPVIDWNHMTSIAGHISVRINDISYSWEGDGMHIDSIENYLNENTYRTGEGMILDISEEEERELENYLKNLPQTKGVYDLENNNCGQVVIRELGKILDKDVSITSPKEAKEWLLAEELVKAIKKYYAGKSDGLSEEIINKLIDLILKKKKESNPDSLNKRHKGTVETDEASCSGNGEGCNGKDDPDEVYPYDPDDNIDQFQIIFLNNILKYKLRLSPEEVPPFFTDTSTGPNGTIKIYRNPYYVNKDPLKTILFDGNNGSGKPMIYRNPFVPGAEYGYESTTYEKWQQKGFVQPEVDPWLR